MHLHGEWLFIRLLYDMIRKLNVSECQRKEDNDLGHVVAMRLGLGLKSEITA
jgi:hypothetical protein